MVNSHETQKEKLQYVSLIMFKKERNWGNLQREVIHKEIMTKNFPELET